MFCQSCVMLMEKGNLRGSNADGSPSRIYCKNCFINGKFTQDITLKEMAAICSERMIKEGKDKEDAGKYVSNILPTLERWR